MIKQFTESTIMVLKAIRERADRKKAAAKAERAALLEAQRAWADDYNELHKSLASGGKKPTVRIDMMHGEMRIEK